MQHIHTGLQINKFKNHVPFVGRNCEAVGGCAMCVSLEMVKRAASPPDAVQTLTAAGDSLVRRSRAFSEETREPGRCLCRTAIA